MAKPVRSVLSCEKHRCSEQRSVLVDGTFNAPARARCAEDKFLPSHAARGQAADASGGSSPSEAADTISTQTRQVVQPGSFLDLLLRTTDRTTGLGLTDREMANQVRLILDSHFTVLISVVYVVSF